MLTNFKLQIEVKLGSKIENSELLRAIDMAKNDVVANKLIMGNAVTSEDFQDVAMRCIRIIRKSDANLISRR